MKAFVGVLFGIVAMLVVGGCTASRDGVAITSDTIGGVVRSPRGPEAGVWVIAETHDLPNRYIKIVVTDDKGRYVLPQLPKAHYQVWVRGYGLVDSKPVSKMPGERADLTATVAPDQNAAAQYYPASYWYALIHPPADAEFANAGKPGSGIPAEMQTSQHFVEQMKEKCLFCHQVGTKTTRQPAQPDDSPKAWDTRFQLFPQMYSEAQKLGPRGLKMFAEWTHDIAAGALPQTPKRPSGLERNVVLTVIGWGSTGWLHDQTSSDRLHPAANAGGPIYGTGMLDGRIYTMDPKTTKTGSMPIPGVDGSPYYPDASPHAGEMDSQARLWVASVGLSKMDQPAWCYDGSTPWSSYFPLQGARYAKSSQLIVYDPATKKVTNYPICAGGNHATFTFDESRVFLAGDTSVISWIDTKVLNQTKDIKQAYGWCPMVLDTSGDGKIDPNRADWEAPKSDVLQASNVGEYGEKLTKQQVQALEARSAKGKDLRISRYLYGIGADPTGGVWGAAYLPYVPSGIVHLVPGAHPPQTCVTEYFEPPKVNGKYLAVGARGVGSDLQGRAWVGFSSGQIGVFDRRKCKVLKGPTATGQHCPEGWTIFDLPVPKLGDTFATSDMAYSHWGDYSNVMGLGKDAHFFPLVNSNEIVALPEGSRDWVRFTVPYPLGFYTRGLDFRMESPNADWRGKGMYATVTSRALTHQEGGLDHPGQQEYVFQMRPDPLAH